MPIRINPPSKKELEQAYLVELRTSTNIGAEYGCSYQTVITWLRGYNIPVRKPGTIQTVPKTHAQQRAYERRRPVCSIIKKHDKELKDDPERLSTEFLQKIIGVKC